MDVPVKREVLESSAWPAQRPAGKGGVLGEQPFPVIDLSSSDSESEELPESSEGVGTAGGTVAAGGKRALETFGTAGAKRVRETSGGSSALDRMNSKNTAVDELAVVLPEGFLQSLPPEEPIQALPAPPVAATAVPAPSPGISSGGGGGGCKQFWKAGDYEGAACGDWDNSSGGLDHVRVHPKFLHSNATSHKWALGAFAELLDNALDEVSNGATYVNIDMIKNRKDGGRMLLVEDNGGGMDPDKMRQCMSLGYSAKSKLANTIGQYGNGFKTSTMRLGADVIVFSRWSGKDRKSSTQSIGLLSYTFLRSTGKEDIVVPMLDYERRGPEWSKIVRSSLGDWNKNVETIIQWSPFSSEEDLLRQFNLMKSHGTRIIIYNLWEDDQGMLELDFDADQHDIQLRGVNRDEKNIQMARQFPNSRHFLTYKHSLRSYVSILYLRLPPGFRIILRGRDVEHHNIVNDMMQTEQITYRPQYGAEGLVKDSNMSAVVTIGFVKDAKHHVDVQGFNVYHKNRLIKPFWRIWNASGSDGRGVIGVLEANFVEPAHDKQGFERTTVLSRLEARLVQMQKTYWSTNCHKIGYAPRRNKKPVNGTADRESSTECDPEESAQPRKKAAASGSKTPVAASDKLYSSTYMNHGGKGFEKSSKGVAGAYRSGIASDNGVKLGKTPTKSQKRGVSLGTSPPIIEDISDDDHLHPEIEVSGTAEKTSEPYKFVSSSRSLYQLERENQELRERLRKSEGEVVRELQEELRRERERRRALETEVEAAMQKIDEMNKEQESLIDIFSEERDRRDNEEETLRKKLKEASNTIQELLDRIKVLEGTKARNGRR